MKGKYTRSLACFIRRQKAVIRKKTQVSVERKHLIKELLSGLSVKK